MNMPILHRRNDIFKTSYCYRNGLLFYSCGIGVGITIFLRTRNSYNL